MNSHGDGAPAWLFSFVDLAFLLLIAMTQVGGDPNALELGEMALPRIQADAAAKLPTGSGDRWQLRVHPPADGAAPFALAHSGAGVGEAADVRLATPALRDRLAELREAKAGRPLLAPHEDSRSQDMLDALALIEEFWPGRRRATVAPVFAQR